MSRPLIVDGGLATGLEELGHSLDSRLWSAGVFLENPRAVEELHLAYIEAGAEILITASYQMSFDGLADAGLDHAAATEAMQRTVEVARRARERSGKSARIAASVGPYGATLADGSEYRGQYGLSVQELVEFHRERFEVLLASDADLLAIETIPSFEEAEALVELLYGTEQARAWVSFSCRDGAQISDGRKLSDAAALLDGCDGVVAIGVNCTAPQYVASLMDEIRRASGKPIIVYPNSGESWDAPRRRWSGRSAGTEFCRLAESWAGKGAWAIGGCCRVGPQIIRELALRLSG